MNRLGVPEHVVHICTVLREAGHEAFVVGGGVRDALLGRTPRDWDVATDASPERVQRLFPRTVPTGIKFGTVTVLAESRRDESPPVEVTTYRGESGYADGRRPDEVRFLGRIEDDLVRRDFTVNAIAYDPASDLIVDPYFGQSDLQRRTLRAVGDPDARFREDGLRVLRAIRLAAELSFDIDPRTGAALRRNGPALQHISRERIGDEWRRILLSPAPGRGLRLLYEYELLPRVLSGEHGPKQVAAAAAALARAHKEAAAGAASPADLLTAATAAAVHVLGPPLVHRRWLLDLVYPKRAIRAALAVTTLLGALAQDPTPQGPELRRLLGQLGRERIPAFVLAWTSLDLREERFGIRQRIEAVAAAGDPLSIGELALDGHDVQRVLGIPAGARVGQLLEKLFEHVLVHPRDNTEQQLTRLLLEAGATDEFC